MTTDTTPPPFSPVEELCEIAHAAYEAAAVEHGWATQEASRVPWVDVPEANKATMRAAMDAVWTYVCSTYIAYKNRMLQELADRVAELVGENRQLRQDYAALSQQYDLYVEGGSGL